MNPSTPTSKALRLRAYLGEKDRSGGKPLHEALLAEARSSGIRGGTVFRGAAGFGAGAVLRSAKILSLSMDLPVVVEIIDSPGAIESFCASSSCLGLCSMVTKDEVDIIHQRAGKI
jgi:PII-like signaling protein